MTPGEFIILSIAVTGTVLALAWSTARPVKKETPTEPGRWRRFRMDPGPLHSGVAGTPVAEEPAGLRLTRDPGLPGEARRLAVQGSGTRIDIAPPWLFPGSRLHVKVGGKALATAARGRRGQPAVTFQFPAVGPPPYQVAGDAARRDYEVRRAGKLVATVFQDRDKGATPRGAYFAEVLRSEDPVPVLALVLAVEACLGPQS
jgi:hypothetical protein